MTRAAYLNKDIESELFIFLTITIEVKLNAIRIYVHNVDETGLKTL